VDIEGTILSSDGQIRSEAITYAATRAGGGPITVWTGGNIYELTKQLRKAGILYKIVSKETMRGAAVRVVIDDQPEAAFKEQYGIEYQEYIQV
jgi:hydroxymethylpyrimidine pyrophosphatase-like HAD family hydrolase